MSVSLDVITNQEIPSNLAFKSCSYISKEKHPLVDIVELSDTGSQYTHLCHWDNQEKTVSLCQLILMEYSVIIHSDVRSNYWVLFRTPGNLLETLPKFLVISNQPECLIISETESNDTEIVQQIKKVVNNKLDKKLWINLLLITLY